MPLADATGNSFSKPMCIHILETTVLKFSFLNFHISVSRLYILLKR